MLSWNFWKQVFIPLWKGMFTWDLRQTVHEYTQLQYSPTVFNSSVYSLSYSVPQNHVLEKDYGVMPW